MGCRECGYYFCEADDYFGRPPGRAERMFELWNTRPLEEVLELEIEDLGLEMKEERERWETS